MFVLWLLVAARVQTGSSEFPIGDKGSANSLTKQLIRLLNETADTVATVRDEATAQYVVDKLHEISIAAAVRTKVSIPPDLLLYISADKSGYEV